MQTWLHPEAAQLLVRGGVPAHAPPERAEGLPVDQFGKPVMDQVDLHAIRPVRDGGGRSRISRTTLLSYPDRLFSDGPPPSSPNRNRPSQCQG